MAVEKISSVNISPVNPYGVQVDGVKPQPVASPESKKDNRKTIALVLGGLAIAGAAGVLIYNARKGRAPSGAGNAAAGFSFGAFAKKFADENIFTKTLEKVSNNAPGVQFRHADGVWQMSDSVQKYGCILEKNAQPDADGIVSWFRYGSSETSFGIMNHKDGKTIFHTFANEQPVPMFSVDSATGKVVENLVDDTQACQKIADDLDLKKLIDDQSYRKTFEQSFEKLVDTLFEKCKYEALAQNVGKTVEEVKAVENSPKFRGFTYCMGALQKDTTWGTGLNRFHSLFNVPECIDAPRVFNFVEGKGQFELLEDFISHRCKFSYRPARTIEGSGSIPSQTVCQFEDVTNGRARIQIGNGENGEFLAYNSQDCKIKYYNPKELVDDNARVTEIVTNNSTLKLEETKDGIKNLEAHIDGRELSADEIAKLKEKLADSTLGPSIIKDLPTRGKDLLETLIR